jgi:DUF2075 family protein
MPRLTEHVLADGSVLCRMARPFDWDHMRWCAEPDCDKPCASVYGWQDIGVGWVGWRAACSRKHALAVWRRELELPA